MCGFVGFTNLKHKLENKKETLMDLTRTLSNRGPDEENFYIDFHTYLGHRRLIILDPKNGTQPMSFQYKEHTYTIVYNGQLYNAKDLREDLITKRYRF